MNTDYRAALAELIEAVDRLLSQGESPVNPGSRLILTVHVEDLGEIADRARALLAAPEAVGVADEELLACDNEGQWEEAKKMILQENWVASVVTAKEFSRRQQIAGLRAVLSRYGTHPAPVPVGERLPEAGDCDAEGRCWWWDDDDDMWRLYENTIRLLCWTHWLPHWALPLPGDQP
jgi:hypothetical protein